MKTLSLGQLIREARLRVGFEKQEALAAALGCKGQYICMIEADKAVPSLEMALKLQQVLYIKHNKLVVRVIEIEMWGTKCTAMRRWFRDLFQEASVSLAMLFVIGLGFSAVHTWLFGRDYEDRKWTLVFVSLMWTAALTARWIVQEVSKEFERLAEQCRNFGISYGRSHPYDSYDLSTEKHERKKQPPTTHRVS